MPTNVGATGEPAMSPHPARSAGLIVGSHGAPTVAAVLRHLHGRVAVSLAIVALVGGVLVEVTGHDGLLGDLGVAALIVALAVFAVAVPWAFGHSWEDRDEHRGAPRR